MKIEHRSTEFTINDLPHTRKEQFFDCIKQYWRQLLGIGLLFLIATLPLIADLLVTDFVAISISSNTSLSAETQQANLFTLQIVKHLILIPCFIIFGFVLSGSLRVYRSITFGEGVLFFADFAKGIKQNVAYVLITSLIFGVLNFVSMLVINIQNAPVPTFVLYLPLFVVIIFVLPIFIVGFAMSNLYTNKYMKTLKSSLYFYVRYFLLYLFSCILSFSFIFSLFIPILIARYIVFIVLVIFLLPIGLLLITLVSNYVFDRHINKSQFTVLYRKGLAPIENELK